MAKKGALKAELARIENENGPVRDKNGRFVKRRATEEVKPAVASVDNGLSVKEMIEKNLRRRKNRYLGGRGIGYESERVYGTNRETASVLSSELEIASRGIQIHILRERMKKTAGPNSPEGKRIAELLRKERSVTRQANELKYGRKRQG